MIWCKNGRNIQNHLSMRYYVKNGNIIMDLTVPSLNMLYDEELLADRSVFGGLCHVSVC